MIDRNLTALDSSLSRRISLPADLIYLVRFPLGVRSAMSKLGATVSSRSAAADMIGIAEPETALGIRHVAWVKERGLPFGLDPREQSEIGARL
ncbi:putative ABC transporter ATP-binding protein [Mycobacteroides abscessus subsp. abscessus]|nr:putative ABC transporter ATP-binding protein [Mycobacteroides abscessus subsp. abscessus]